MRQGVLPQAPESEERVKGEGQLGMNVCIEQAAIEYITKKITDQSITLDVVERPGGV